MHSPSPEQIRADILHKLYRKRKWGAAHTPLVHLHKWAPPQYARDYKEAANELHKEGFLIIKPTHYGEEVSLNPRRREEIVAIVKKFFSDVQ